MFSAMVHENVVQFLGVVQHPEQERTLYLVTVGIPPFLFRTDKRGCSSGGTGIDATGKRTRYHIEEQTHTSDLAD